MTMSNPATERRLITQRLLMVMGTLTLLVSFTWLGATTVGRLAGVLWLESILGWIPLDQSMDWKMGLGWLLAGALMTLGGICGPRSRRLESLGFAAGVFWPLLMGVIFLIAWVSGEADAGYASTISYALFAAPFVVMATLPRPREVTPTGSLSVLTSEAGGQPREGGFDA